jgi:hypothetical protein
LSGSDQMKAMRVFSRGDELSQSDSLAMQFFRAGRMRGSPSNFRSRNAKPGMSEVSGGPFQRARHNCAGRGKNPRRRNDRIELTIAPLVIVYQFGVRRNPRRRYSPNSRSTGGQ